jgi:hypothetical protein
MANRHPAPRRRRHPGAVGLGLLPAAAALCTVVLAGCAGNPPAQSATAKPASLTDIAAAIGCTAEITVNAKELRQGACNTRQGAYRMTTFTRDEGQRAWLTEAQMYGGDYLVGKRWVVISQTPGSLTALRGKLGGTIQVTHMSGMG